MTIVFDNFRSAKEYFGEKDTTVLHKFNQFEKDVSKNLKVKENLSVPSGWKIDSENEHGQYPIIASDGTKFSSRLNAVKNMLAGNFDDHDMKEMKEYLVHEGWKEKSSLPYGWKYKKNPSSESKVSFLSSEANILVSVEDAKEHLLTHTANKQQYLESITNLTRFLEEMSTKTQELKSIKKSEWKDSKTVPDGWRVKICNPKHILAPDGKRFKSVRNTIQFMVKESWRLEDLDSMRSKLSYDGWTLDPRLPHGWAMKIKPKSDCIRYISPAGEELMSTRAAVMHLKANHGAQRDIDKFQTLLKVNRKYHLANML